MLYQRQMRNQYLSNDYLSFKFIPRVVEKVIVKIFQQIFKSCMHPVSEFL